MADGNAPRAALVQARGGALDPGSESDLVGQHVGGAAGQDGQGHAGMHHAFGSFIDGAIAAGDNHQVGAAGDVPARNDAGGSAAAGGDYGQVVAIVPEDCGHARDERVPVPSELARVGVVDQDGVLENGYGVFSGSSLDYR